MNSQRVTIILLILIVLAAMWTSGRLTRVINAVTKGAGNATKK